MTFFDVICWKPFSRFEHLKGIVWVTEVDAWENVTIYKLRQAFINTLVSDILKCQKDPLSLIINLIYHSFDSQSLKHHRESKTNLERIFFGYQKDEIPYPISFNAGISQVSGDNHILGNTSKSFIYKLLFVL